MGKKSKNKSKINKDNGQRLPQQQPPQQRVGGHVMTEPSNQIVLSLYNDPPHCGTYHSCTNYFKDEPPDVEFQECSACEAVKYCSKECQIAHWKSHKKRCQNIDNLYHVETLSFKGDELDAVKKSHRKIPGRVHRFRGYFGPIIDLRLLPLQFVQPQMKHGITSFPTSHVVKLYPSELP